MGGSAIHDSRGSGRMPLRQAKDSDTTTFHVASTTFAIQTSNESYEIQVCLLHLNLIIKALISCYTVRILMMIKLLD